MRTALQNADSYNDLANTPTSYDLAKTLLLQSRAPAIPQLPHIDELLALCGIKASEPPGNRGELALPPETWCHAFSFVRVTSILCSLHTCALYLLRLLCPSR
jgi:hypothetical protein